MTPDAYVRRAVELRIAELEKRISVSKTTPIDSERVWNWRGELVALKFWLSKLEMPRAS